MSSVSEEARARLGAAHPDGWITLDAEHGRDLFEAIPACKVATEPRGMLGRVQPCGLRLMPGGGHGPFDGVTIRWGDRVQLTADGHVRAIRHVLGASSPGPVAPTPP